jgi:hypothetical protein
MDINQKEIIERALEVLKGQPSIGPESKSESKGVVAGITLADVLRVFGGKVIFPTKEDMTKPETCDHCAGSEYAGVIKRAWPDGRWDWGCHACGRSLGGDGVERVAKIKPSAKERAHPLKALEGKRGGVFCRSCHLPMPVSILDGGYDWSCKGCAITWRYRS